MLSGERVQQRLARRALALVLAGGRGSRLRQLTDRRAKPAVFFGGKFRIIDFALSNCLNSGVRRIGVLTQYKAHSLLRHLQMGWSFLRPEMNEFLDLLPAQQRIDEASWYRGTADAVFQNFDILRAANPQYFVVLAGDHVYKMDYSNMLADHVDKGAGCTVACVEVPLAEAAGFGVMTVDPSMRIVDFAEKPRAPRGMPDKPDRALASMGIYIFDADFLYAELQRDHGDPASSHDFGADVIPSLVGRGLAVAHSFEESCVKTTPEAESYWRDVGTIDAYYEANIDLTKVLPELNLYDSDWPIWTYQDQMPPAKFVFDDDHCRGLAIDSIVSGGCIVSGSSVRRSILFSNVRVYNHSQIEDSVILPNAQIGPSAVVRNAVIDKHCKVPEGMQIGVNLEVDRMRFHVTEKGRVLVVPEMLGQHVHHLR